MLRGNEGNDFLYGGRDDDTLFGQEGSDVLDGGQGDDALNGGAGADTSTGGSGRDMCVYGSVLDSVVGDCDTIIGFVHGTDRIDVSAIDSEGPAGSPFVWGGTSPTEHGVWYTVDGLNTTLHFDTNGSAGDEMAITLVGTNLQIDGGILFCS